MIKIQLVAVVVIVVTAVAAHAQSQKVSSDHWTATDALGRTLPGAAEAGPPKKDKFIALFYWTWHQGDDDTIYQVKNITEIVRKYS